MSRIMSRLVAMAWLLVAMDANLEERVATLEAEIGSLSNELQVLRALVLGQPESEEDRAECREGRNITSTGAYCTVLLESQKFNEELAEGICKIVDPTDTIVDLGARIGMYTRYFRERSCVRLALAYDGGIGVREMSSGLVQHLDLTQLHNIGVFDWVLSLEVAEHIPPEYESVYIENLHRHNRKGIIMSWAFPGQSGVGHVNEQHAPQVRLMFKELGYLFDPRATRRLRSTCHSHLSYFMNTLLVFRRNTTFH
ncbi:unnamed protein product [Durusdinium trenchii]|uniref:Uncharacterized protein n=2 Tax=Durusdinium trenchii TaxID=1381693 RepID=A0ABP0RVJ9_9DINO